MLEPQTLKEYADVFLAVGIGTIAVILIVYDFFKRQPERDKLTEKLVAQTERLLESQTAISEQQRAIAEQQRLDRQEAKDRQRAMQVQLDATIKVAERSIDSTANVIELMAAHQQQVSEIHMAMNGETRQINGKLDRIIDVAQEARDDIMVMKHSRCRGGGGNGSC